MKTSAKYFLTLILTYLGRLASAQDAEMADTFRAEGKIYVVVAIVLIVLTGLILFLFLLDRKLTRLERTIEGKEQTKRNHKSF